MTLKNTLFLNFLIFLLLNNQLYYEYQYNHINKFRFFVLKFFEKLSCKSLS